MHFKRYRFVQKLPRYDESEMRFMRRKDVFKQWLPKVLASLFAEHKAVHKVHSMICRVQLQLRIV